jgi:hypothetical protein
LQLTGDDADQSVFVVEGDLVEEGVGYGPGSFLFAKAGTPHGPHGSSGGCVLLSWYSGPPDFVPVADRPHVSLQRRRL